VFCSNRDVVGCCNDIFPVAPSIMAIQIMVSYRKRPVIIFVPHRHFCWVDSRTCAWRPWQFQIVRQICGSRSLTYPEDHLSLIQVPISSLRVGLVVLRGPSVALHEAQR